MAEDYFLVGMAALMLCTLAAVPRQDERPPQPLFEDFYSGTVSLQGSPAPTGSQLMACIIDCETGFQSQPVRITSAGGYDGLELNPSDEALIGRSVSFYLVNQYGRIKAVETADFVGIFDFYTLDLTFNQPLPVPTPTPTVTPIPTITPTALIAGTRRPVNNCDTKIGLGHRCGHGGRGSRVNSFGPPQGPLVAFNHRRSAVSLSRAAS